MIKLIARLMWALPALMILISGYLFKAGLDQRRTLEEGVQAVGQVTEYEINKRSEITYSYIKLRVDQPDGVLEETLSLPISLSIPLEGRETLPVRVLKGASQQIVIEDVARAQWRMSLIHSVMAGIGAIMLLVGVGAWNRFLNRRGDPGEVRSTEY